MNKLEQLVLKFPEVFRESDELIKFLILKKCYTHEAGLKVREVFESFRCKRYHFEIKK